MRTTVRFQSVMTLLLASAASVFCAPSVSALSDTGFPTSADRHAAPATSLEMAFEGPAANTPATAPAAPKPDAAQAGDKSASDKSSSTTSSGTASPGAKPSGDAPAATDAADQKPAEIIRDLSTLPAPVKAMREKIIEAAASGDVERMRPLMETSQKSQDGDNDDPIETLKGFSGDPDGQEILAIILDLLSTGVARVDAGTPDEVYVWPYFVGKPLADLTPPERVELLRIVTAGDLMGMEEAGNYNFYRLGITPDGKWKFIAGGD
ncbi:hypothetical protein [Neorhizobium sp. NCHU2750]|uniref:hypothetical protein n=1 Tax=Neorhizobium sp. NCHU2750 TaxID=1825976 RepID=UPI000E727F62|nr:hypothetical protein NCHU2750_09440 [Neorhizobium sp. NCHU2750]